MHAKQELNLMAIVLLVEESQTIRRVVEMALKGSGHDIIAYCRMSHRATVLYFALTQLLGFKNVKIYDGSWTEWGNLVGVPVER